MKSQKTQEVGAKTQNAVKSDSRFNVKNKDPLYDYCFRRRTSVEQEGIDKYGFSPVSKATNTGEDWDLPEVLMKGAAHIKKTHGRALVHEDVVLCKRPKEVADYYQEKENKKYNNFQQLIKSVAPRAQSRLRDMHGGARVTDSSTGMNLTQRKGPTEGNE